MKVAAFLLVAGSILGHGTASAEESGLAACRSISDDTRRLSCFDKIAVEALPSVKSWIFSDTSSPFERSRRLTATKRAAETSRSRSNAEMRADLSIECDAGELKFYVSYQDMVANGAGATPITYQIDGGPLVTQKWSGSSNLKSYGLWTTKATSPLLADLNEAKELTIKSEASYFGATSATFALDGIADAAKIIRQACG